MGCAISLAVMLGVDLVFIAVSGVRAYHGMPRDNWHISVDGGFAEIWQYAKWTMLILVSVVLASKSRAAVYLVWAIIFLYLLIDDSLSIHEDYGLRLASQLGLRPAFGLRARDFGELMVTAAAAGVLLGALAIVYRKTLQEKPRIFTRHMLWLLVALVFFGVGVDVLDIAVPWATARSVLEQIEDGGEMIVASLMTGYALAISTAGLRP